MDESNFSDSSVIDALITPVILYSGHGGLGKSILAKRVADELRSLRYDLGEIIILDACNSGLARSKANRDVSRLPEDWRELLSNSLPYKRYTSPLSPVDLHFFNEIAENAHFPLSFSTTTPDPIHNILRIQPEFLRAYLSVVENFSSDLFQPLLSLRPSGRFTKFLVKEVSDKVIHRDLIRLLRSMIRQLKAIIRYLLGIRLADLAFNTLRQIVYIRRYSSHESRLGGEDASHLLFWPNSEFGATTRMVSLSFAA